MGQTGQPSASPLPSVPFSIPATLALPLPGTDKVQLEAGTSCHRSLPAAPTEPGADSCTPGGRSTEPLPRLGRTGLRWGGRVGPQTLFPWQLGTPRRAEGQGRGAWWVGLRLLFWWLRRELLRPAQGPAGGGLPFGLCLFCPQVSNQFLPDSAHVPHMHPCSSKRARQTLCDHQSIP